MSYAPEQTPNIIDDVMRDVWIREDLDAIDIYFHPDAKFHGRIRDTILNRDEFRDWVAQFQSMASITSFKRVFTVEGADGRFGHVIEGALSSHTSGKTGLLMGMFFDRVQNGVIVESYANADLMNFFETTGAVPENAMLLMLAGATLT